jgi:hypothetical protein
MAAESPKKRTQTKPIKANKMPKQTQNKPNQTQFQFSTMLNCAICSAACHLEYERYDNHHNKSQTSIYH